MKENTIEEYQDQLSKCRAQNKELLEEVEVKNKAVQILLASGLISKAQLSLATELAGGIK